MNTQQPSQQELIMGIASQLSNDPNKPDEKAVKVVTSMVSAAQKGDQEAAKQLQGIIQLIKVASQGDSQAAQQLSQIKTQINSSEATMAKQGAKLEYIKRLNGKCPEGFEAVKYKLGGEAGFGMKCKKCSAAEKAEKGAKVQKLEKGKSNSKAVEEFKKGKTTKKQDGGIANRISAGKRNDIFNSGNSGPQSR